MQLICEFWARPLDEAQLADYYVFVRKPMDLSTVKHRLDGTLPNLGTSTASTSSRIESILNKIKQHSKYDTYGECLADIRRILDNAIRYNAQYQEADSSSAEVYKAALIFKSKVEELIAKFTLKVVDKLERLRIKRDEESEKEVSSIFYFL